MKPAIQAFFDEKTFTVTYLVSNPASRRAIVIDSVLDFEPQAARTATRSADRLLAAARANNLVIEWILETHAHADHLSAAAYLKEVTGAKIAIGEHIRDVQKFFAPIFDAKDVTGDGAPFDRLLKDGETLSAGNMMIEVMNTPGHTPACVSYKIADNVFVGDTLFMPDYGTARTDFPVAMRKHYTAQSNASWSCRRKLICGCATTTGQPAGPITSGIPPSPNSGRIIFISMTGSARRHLWRHAWHVTKHWKCRSLFCRQCK